MQMKFRLSLSVLFFLILSSVGHTSIYKTSEFQIKFPNHWVKPAVSPPYAVRQYKLIGKHNFIIFDVIHAFLEQETVQKLINDFPIRDIRADVTDIFISSNSNMFTNIKLLKITIEKIDHRNCLHVTWKGTAKKGYVLTNNDERVIHVSEYAIPDPNSWLHSYILVAQATTWNKKVRSTCKKIALSFKLKQL